MFVFVLVYIVMCPSGFAIVLTKKRAGCFASIVFLMSCFCQCSVALCHGAMSWSAVCDRGIS